MNRSIRLWAGAVAVLVVAGAAGALARHYFGAADSQPVSALTSATLSDAKGASVSLAQWRGKPMLVNFWGTWCAPCREEMPLLNDMAARFPQVQFVGIAIDEPAALAQYAAQHTTRYPLLQGDVDLLALTSKLGNTAQALPFSVLINASGDVQQIKLGAFHETELAEKLRQLASSR
ncbi:MAG: TlpA disulfide reductase family protein [Rhodocyclaceae bacterium]